MFIWLCEMLACKLPISDIASLPDLQVLQACRAYPLTCLSSQQACKSFRLCTCKLAGALVCASARALFCASSSLHDCKCFKWCSSKIAGHVFFNSPSSLQAYLYLPASLQRFSCKISSRFCKHTFLMQAY